MPFSERLKYLARLVVNSIWAKLVGVDMVGILRPSHRIVIIRALTSCAAR